MAGLTNADPSHHLSVDTSPPPIPKDMQGSDSSAPLSPQWLLPKLGDNKLGVAVREPDPHVGMHTDPAKDLGNVEDLGIIEKKKDVYRPSFYDTEKGRRDRWGDEERETNSTIRRDFRRDGEEVGDSRKLERRSNTASRYSGEPRRFPSERWTDSGNRESAYEPRRESKWNTRWGPDDKESENRREKWSGKDGKDGESSHDKGGYHTIQTKDINSQGKDTDKEGDHYRSWRSSLAVNRGKGETSPYLPSTTHKPSPMFGYGRGKGDIGASAFSVDRGRVVSSASNVSGGPARHLSFGTASERSNGSHRDPHILRYSRMKLLDICRTTDLKGYRMSFEWFQEIPSLLQAEPLMPLSLTVPTAEELFILESIDKGDILSSSVPLVSKDGPNGKNSADSGLLVPTQSGIGEDVEPVVSDHRDERTVYSNKDHAYVERDLYDKYSLGFDSKLPLGESFCQSQEVLTNEASKFQVPANKAYVSSKGEVFKGGNTIPCGSQSVGVGSSWSSNNLITMTGDGSGSSDTSWLNTRKEMVIEPRDRCGDSSYLVGDLQWQDIVNHQSDVRGESRIRKQPSETIEQEGDGFILMHGQSDPFIINDKLTDRKPQQNPPPEHLSLFYQDPQGQIQGPFCGSNLIEWFDAGYFGIDLLVRHASASADTPFSLLGDVIPQLRARIRPPPGFGLARQNGSVDVPNRGKFTGPGGIHAGISDSDLMKNGQVLRNESKVKAENQFLESLMSGKVSSSLLDNYSLLEGTQGYNELAGGRSSLGLENTNDMKYQPQKMPLEQQSPLLSPYKLGRESPAILSKPDAIGEFPIPPRILPQMGEVSRQIPQSLQPIDLLSILQSAADRTPPPPINSVLPLWPNFPEAQSLKNKHGSLDIMKDTSELHPNQQNSQTGFGNLPKRLQPQFQPPLSNQTPVGSLSSGVIPPEQLVTSEFSQDAHMLNLLRQQYMLTQQLHSQVPLPTHLNQMELLLLMQRQQQEQQKNQLLLQQQEQQQNQIFLQQQQQQQQHFLSHPVYGFHSYKHNNEPSFSSLGTEVVNENASLKKSIHQMHEVASQGNRLMHVLDSNDSHASKFSNLNLYSAQEASITGSMHLPLTLSHQFTNVTPYSNEMDALPLLDVAPTQTSDLDQTALMSNIVSAGEGHAKEAFVPRLNSISIGTSEVSQELPQINEVSIVASDAATNLVLSYEGEGILDSKPSVSEMIDGAKISPGTISEQVGEAAELKGVDNAEQCPAKKISEKKSRKHKNSQLRAAAEYGKGSVKATALGQKSKDSSETGVVEKDLHMEVAEPLKVGKTGFEAGGKNCAPSLMGSLDSHGCLLSSGALDKKTKVDETKAKEVEFVLPLSNNQAWKPASGQKIKPLLEIQVEEQRRSRTQSLAADTIPEIVPTNISAAPSSGSLINLDQKYTVDTVQCDLLDESISGNPKNWQNHLNLRNISQLHEVLDEKALSKESIGKDNTSSEEKGKSSQTLPQMGTEMEVSVDNDDFIEAKDTRKSRKKAAKNKAVKASLPSNNSAVLSVSLSTTEQTKATRQIQQDKDLLPSPPTVPSLGDFLFWKGDQTSTVSSPAWSTESVNLQKPAFLRDIFKEQNKKKEKSGQQQLPIPTPTKVQPSSRKSGGSNSSALVPGSSPPKALVPINSKPAAPTQKSSIGLGQHKTGMEDDLFWGPLDQSKEGSRSGFPSLASPSKQKVKGTAVKGAHGDHSVTSSLAISRSPSEGKKDTESKYSEAMDFRNWCEEEWFRLTATNDTSFLEFCLKQTATEAAVLLRENLASLDRNHEFIDKFINYMEFLSSEITEMAFKSKKNSKESQSQTSHGTPIQRNLDAEADGVEGSNKGKKKGKKGKKLNPSMLGFNVVSTRIMMGEIQTIED